MGRRAAALALVALLLTAALAACSDDAKPEPSASPETNEPTSPEPTPTESSAAPPPVPSPLAAGDLPDALSLKDVAARTVTAKPFADFAVAVGSGVWVSGVTPGAVRYDAASGAITARTRIPGEVGQALAATANEVLVPVSVPALLLRLDQATGAVLAKVKLPAGPVSESAVGVDGDTGYVLVDTDDPRIVVVEGDRVVDEIPAPDASNAVRAGFGSLWVPTGYHTVERYSLETEMWETIPVGLEPRFLDVGFSAVWVMNQGDGSVTRIDARSGAAETIPVTGERIGGGDLTVGAGAVWLRTDSQVARIDSRSAAVTHLIDLPPGSGSVAATDGLLLITNHDHLAVHLVPLPLPD